MKSREALMSKITTVVCYTDDSVPRECAYLTEEEKGGQKSKCLVQSPDAYFMDVKFPGCCKNTTLFSHAQVEVLCVDCFTVLSQPLGRKHWLAEGWSFRKYQH